MPRRKRTLLRHLYAKYPELVIGCRWKCFTQFSKLRIWTLPTIPGCPSFNNLSLVDEFLTAWYNRPVKRSRCNNIIVED